MPSAGAQPRRRQHECRNEKPERGESVESDRFPLAFCVHLALIFPSTISDMSSQPVMSPDYLARELGLIEGPTTVPRMQAV
jgi:hypothetical protein